MLPADSRRFCISALTALLLLLPGASTADPLTWLGRQIIVGNAVKDVMLDDAARGLRNAGALGAIAAPIVLPGTGPIVSGVINEASETAATSAESLKTNGATTRTLVNIVTGPARMLDPTFGRPVDRPVRPPARGPAAGGAGKQDGGGELDLLGVKDGQQGAPDARGTGGDEGSNGSHYMVYFSKMPRRRARPLWVLITTAPQDDAGRALVTATKQKLAAAGIDDVDWVTRHVNGDTKFENMVSRAELLKSMSRNIETWQRLSDEERMKAFGEWVQGFVIGEGTASVELLAALLGIELDEPNLGSPLFDPYTYTLGTTWKSIPQNHPTMRKLRKAKQQVDSMIDLGKRFLDDPVGTLCDVPVQQAMRVTNARDARASGKAAGELAVHVAVIVVSIVDLGVTADALVADAAALLGRLTRSLVKFGRELAQRGAVALVRFGESAASKLRLMPARMLEAVEGAPTLESSMASKAKGFDYHVRQSVKDEAGLFECNGDTRCFARGTPVWTERGLLPIERVRELAGGGPALASRVDGDAPVRMQGVTRTFSSISNHLRKVLIAAASGATETLATTDHHPFWVTGRGWCDAGDLLAGDRLVQADGRAAVVLATTREAHPEGVPVFNLEVQGSHTYMVGESGVLVHNRCVPVIVIAVNGGARWFCGDWGEEELGGRAGRGGRGERNERGSGKPARRAAKTRTPDEKAMLDRIRNEVGLEGQELDAFYREIDQEVRAADGGEASLDYNELLRIARDVKTFQHSGIRSLEFT